MHRAVVDWFVDEDLAIANLQVEGAVRVGADPGFVLDWRALVAKVREGHEIAHIALLALGEIEFAHPTRPFKNYRTNPGSWGAILRPPGVRPVYHPSMLGLHVQAT